MSRFSKPIDLDALERVVGLAPTRYREGDARNAHRLIWWRRATHALGELLLRAPVHPSATYMGAMKRLARERRKRS